MYSRSLASLFYLAAALLLATLISTTYALPTAEPGRTVGDVVSENRNMACRMGGCFIKNGTSSTDSSAVAAADAAANTPSAPAANGALSLSAKDFIAPTVLAGTSLFLLL